MMMCLWAYAKYVDNKLDIIICDLCYCRAIYVCPASASVNTRLWLKQMCSNLLPEGIGESKNKPKMTMIRLIEMVQSALNKYSWGGRGSNLYRTFKSKLQFNCTLGVWYTYFNSLGYRCFVL